MEKYRAKNWQTKEIREGTFEELSDLDNRTWDLIAIKDIPEHVEMYHPIIREKQFTVDDWTIRNLTQMTISGAPIMNPDPLLTYAKF